VVAVAVVASLVVPAAAVVLQELLDAPVTIKAAAAVVPVVLLIQVV
jgi:hypothetical protein